MSSEYVGGWFALGGVLVGFACNCVYQEYKQRKKVGYFRKAILAEIHELYGFYKKYYFDQIKNVENGQFVDAGITVAELKFYVYESCALQISELKDQKEIGSIVAFYAKSKQMVDSLLFNSALLDDYMRISIEDHVERDVANSKLIYNAQVLRALHEEIVPIAEMLIVKLER